MIKKKNLGRSLEKLSGETITKKERKLHRDHKAITNNKAYLWSNFQSPRRPRPYASSQVHNQMSRDHLVSKSSVSSALSNSSSFFPPRNTKYPQKRYKEFDDNQTSNQKRRPEPEHTGGTTNQVVMILPKHNFTQPTTPKPTHTPFLATPLQNPAHQGTLFAHFQKNLQDHPTKQT